MRILLLELRGVYRELGASVCLPGDVGGVDFKSQTHEGWKLIRNRYDDGGYSGGSMERPALKRLLDDVRARRIDVIVVYKVDQRRRSRRVSGLERSQSIP
jgi:hypothetical protein